MAVREVRTRRDFRPERSLGGILGLGEKEVRRRNRTGDLSAGLGITGRRLRLANRARGRIPMHAVLRPSGWHCLAALALPVAALTHAFTTMTVTETKGKVAQQRVTSKKQTDVERSRLELVTEKELNEFEDYNMARRVGCDWPCR